MRVLVCGGRDYSDYLRLDDVLKGICFDRGWYSFEGDIFIPKVTVISGGAKGADHLAILWAMSNNCDYQIFPAKWKLHGKAAGPIRNSEMIRDGKPDLVVAFPGGVGTQDMIRQAKKNNIEVVKVR